MDKSVFVDISELVTMQGAAAKNGRRILPADLAVIKDAAMVVAGGKIEWIGPRGELPASQAKEISLQHKTVLPAFLECHTHLAFAGSRAQEFEWRINGMSYQEIAAKGGGIVSTMAATRACGEDELRNLMQTRATRFLEQGVTTLEVKSGYGLDEASEIKSLRIANELQGPRIVRTFLGPHSKPPEFQTIESYFEYVFAKLLPKIASEKLADRVDIFVEKGFFTADQAHRYFKKAKALGLGITAHVEQLSHSGGTRKAIEFGACSVDHIVEIDQTEIAALADTTTVAVLLPASDFYLRMPYPRARELIDRGACVALSTDFNPGTSPTQDLSLVGVLARLEMRMSLPEVLSAWTVGAAHALKKARDLGSLECGKICDFVVLDGSYDELFYSVGHHPVEQVWKSGLKCFEKKF